jgi:hypothetical protein
LDREANPVGAAASGRAKRSVRRLSANMVPLVAGDGEGEEATGDAASFDPQCIPAWEAAKLAVMRRSTKAGAGDTSTDGIVGMARIARMVVLLSLLTLLASCPAGWGANVGHSIEWLSYSVSLYSLTFL